MVEEIPCCQLDAIDDLIREDPLAGFRQVSSTLDSARLDRCLRARTLDRLGTVCRILRDLERSDYSYSEAAKACQCTACHWDRLRRLTYLRADQGLLLDAQKCADEAIESAPNLEMVGRCRVALSYVQVLERNYSRALESARRATRELPRDDLLYIVGAITTIGNCARRIEPTPATVLIQARNDLRDLRRRWPRNSRYRSARGKVAWVTAFLGYRLGDVDPGELRSTLARVQRLHVELGLLRDALLITSEAAEVCAEMQREDLVAKTLIRMLDALPSSLPRHLTVAVRELRHSLDAIDRCALIRAAADLRNTLTQRPSLAL